MALAQDLLDAVTAETTAVDGYLALSQKLIDDGTIPAEAGAKLLATINANKDKLNAAILANTPTTPTVVESSPAVDTPAVDTTTTVN